MSKHDIDGLVEGLKASDRKSFETLYGMYADAICGAIQHVVRDTAIAEEICQDVFLTVWEKAHQYDSSKGRFFTWLLNIGRNRAIDYVRSRAYSEKKQNLHPENLVGMAGEQEQRSDSDHPASQKLQVLIKGLSGKCREIIQFLYFRGYTQKAVSEELKIPLGTVKTRNRDCIGRLRKNLV